MPTIIQDLIAKFSVHLIYIALVAIYKIVRSSLERRHPLIKPLFLGVITLFFLISTIVSFTHFPTIS